MKITGLSIDVSCFLSGMVRRRFPMYPLGSSVTLFENELLRAVTRSLVTSVVVDGFGVDD